jgi:hypothetical protein
VHTNNSESCDDGLYCNGADVCSGGECGHAGSPCSGTTAQCDEASDGCVQCLTDDQCNDGNVCTTDTCDVSNLCVHRNSSDGTPCLGGGTCSNGVCALRAGVTATARGANPEE